MKKENNIAFANVNCPNSSEVKNLKSIAIVAGEKTFFETVSYANTVENVKEKLNNWILSFEDVVFINTTRQKEVEVIKELLSGTAAREKIKIKVYLKMIFEEMFVELKKKGFSLLRISFLYDLSQQHFENNFENYMELENSRKTNNYAADLTELKLANTNRKALLSTLLYLRSLPSYEDVK